MAALFAAAAQSATGDSNGYDNRSPGEEAVAGSVASILDTAQTIVERDANIAPTITISPGYQSAYSSIRILPSESTCMNKLAAVLFSFFSGYLGVKRGNAKSGEGL